MHQEVIEPEHELRSLIEESKSLIIQNRAMIAKGELTLTKMNRTLKGFIVMAIPIVLAFFWSFYDNGKMMTRMDETKISKVEVDDLYAKKTDIVFLQNNMHDLNIATFKQNDWVVDEDVEKAYTRALKEFVGDISRGM